MHHRFVVSEIPKRAIPITPEWLVKMGIPVDLPDVSVDTLSAEIIELKESEESTVENV